MKKILSVFLMLIAGVVFAADPKVGDTREQVLDALGQPQGKMAINRHEVLYFFRGEIELLDGTVTKVKLVSQAEAQARLAKEKAEAEARAQASLEQKQKLIEQGTLEKANTLASPFFASQSAAQQLAYWQAFAKKYPDISVADEIAKSSVLAQQEDQKKIPNAPDLAPAPKQEDENLLKPHRIERYAQPQPSSGGNINP